MPPSLGISESPVGACLPRVLCPPVYMFGETLLKLMWTGQPRIGLCYSLYPVVSLPPTCISLFQTAGSNHSFAFEFLFLFRRFTSCTCASLPAFSTSFVAYRWSLPTTFLYGHVCVVDWAPLHNSRIRKSSYEKCNSLDGLTYNCMHVRVHHLNLNLYVVWNNGFLPHFVISLTLSTSSHSLTHSLSNHLLHVCEW